MTETIDAINWTHPLVKYYISAALALWPAIVICRRFAITRAGALLLALPYIGFAAVCVFVAVAGRTRKQGTVA